MWKVVIKQEYEYSYQDGTTSKGTHESTYLFLTYARAMNFIECAIETGSSKTWAQIEFVKQEGKENGES